MHATNIVQAMLRGAPPSARRKIEIAARAIGMTGSEFLGAYIAELMGEELTEADHLERSKQSSNYTKEKAATRANG